MKYQITCDNCGTQFIVDAGEGQTIECNCPHCHSIMEVTLPLVSDNTQSEERQSFNPPNGNSTQGIPEQKPDRTVLWGIIIGLLVVVVGALAYFALRPSEIPSEEPKTPEVTDTIPYETPTKQVVTPQIDTVKTAPVKKEIVEEEQKKKQHNRQENDSTDIYSDVDITE